jgi:uncharacterized protein (TIGR00369 family)
MARDVEDMLEQGRAAIARVPFLGQLGVRPVAPSTPEAYAVELPIRTEIINSLGSPHGGTIATIVDHAGGFGLIALEGYGGPTTDLHVRYLDAPRGDVLRAEATVVRAGRQLAVMAVRVTDVEGRLVALGSMTVARRPDRPA